MSYLVLSWALPNGVSVKEMELTICRLISFIYPSFASLRCLVCQQLIPGLTSTARQHPPAVIHPKSPQYTRPSHTRSFHHETPKYENHISKRERGLFSKKRELEMREENPTLPKSCKQGVQIKDQIVSPSVSPFPSIPWNSTRSEFGWVQTLHGSPFGSAI